MVTQQHMRQVPRRRIIDYSHYTNPPVNTQSDTHTLTQLQRAQLGERAPVDTAAYTQCVCADIPHVVGALNCLYSRVFSRQKDPR